MLEKLLPNLRLYVVLSLLAVLLGSYAAVYSAGYRARATRDRTDHLQALLDAATRDKQRFELAAKMSADEARLLAQYRNGLQERLRDLETELANPRGEPAQVAVRPVEAVSCPVPRDPYLASPADLDRMRRAAGARGRKPAAAPAVRPGKRAAPAGG